MYREFETMVGISVIPRTCTFSAILTVPLDIPKSLAVVAFINILFHHQPREHHEGSSERAVRRAPAVSAGNVASRHGTAGRPAPAPSVARPKVNSAAGRNGNAILDPT